MQAIEIRERYRQKVLTSIPEMPQDQIYKMIVQTIEQAPTPEIGVQEAITKMTARKTGMLQAMGNGVTPYSWGYPQIEACEEFLRFVDQNLDFLHP